MALKVHVDIVSAEAVIFSGLAEKVVVPAEMGELGVYPRHAPLLTRLRPGLVRLALTAEKEEVLFVSSGFLEVQPHLVTLLADTVVRSKDLDETAALAAKERAEHAIKQPISPDDYARYKAGLELSTMLLRGIDQLRARSKR